MPIMQLVSSSVTWIKMDGMSPFLPNERNEAKISQLLVLSNHEQCSTVNHFSLAYVLLQPTTRGRARHFPRHHFWGASQLTQLWTCAPVWHGSDPQEKTIFIWISASNQQIQYKGISVFENAASLVGCNTVKLKPLSEWSNRFRQSKTKPDRARACCITANLLNRSCFTGTVNVKSLLRETALWSPWHSQQTACWIWCTSTSYSVMHRDMCRGPHGPHEQQSHELSHQSQVTEKGAGGLHCIISVSKALQKHIFFLQTWTEDQRTTRRQPF